MPALSAYALTTDFSSPALGLPARALTGIATDDMDQALEAASRIADGYLVSRFVLPLTACGQDLRWCVCSIAAYNLMSGKGFNPEGSDLNIRLRFEDAMRWLKDVQAGRVTPVGAVDSSVPPIDPTDDGSGSALVESDELRGW